MSIKLPDGSILDTNDIMRVLAIVEERAKGRSTTLPTVESGEKFPVPVKVMPLRIEEIRSKDGVTVKTGNLKIKKRKDRPQADHENFIEVKHKDCAIRVWRDNNGAFFGCNCIDLHDPENVRYMEFSYEDFRDENRVFKSVQSWIDGGGMKNG